MDAGSQASSIIMETFFILFFIENLQAMSFLKLCKLSFLQRVHSFFDFSVHVALVY